MFGGISTTNYALFLSLERSHHTFVGIEMPRARSIKGATVFYRFSPNFFSHRIIQVPDLWENFSAYDLATLENLERYWKIAIDLTMEVLRDQKPDVVLLNGTGIVPWVLSQAAERLKIPMVIRYAGILTIETQMSRPRALELYRTVEKTFMPRVKHAIFPSAVAKRVVEEVVTGKPIENATILPNPIFVPKTYRNNYSGTPAIASIGRWARVKNFQAYFELHRKLRRQRFPHRAFFVSDRLVDDTNGPKMPSTIEIVDPMSQDKLWQFYTHLNLLVVPSTFETFCNVAAEAVVTGTPVLVSETVGFSEVLKAFGLDNMVVSSFEDIELVAERAKILVKERVPFFKRRAIARYLNPNTVHTKLIQVLEDVISQH